MAGGNASMTIFIGGDNSDFLKKWEATKRALRKGLGQDALDASESIATGLAAAAAGMAALGVASVKLASDMQSSRKAFTHLMGDAQQAEKFLADLASFAADTPFELPGIVNASKRLLAFGFAAQDIIPIMAAVGDAVSLMGGGQEAIDGVIRSIGQIQAKGKLSAEEINQLAERNINAWKYVAEELGVSVPEAMKLTEKGAVDSTTAINGIIRGMQREFKGGMEGLSKEIPGLLSTIKDNARSVMTEVGDSITKALDLQPKLQNLATYLSQFASYVKSNGINEALRNMIPKELTLSIFVLAGALTGAAIPAMLAFGVSVWTAMAPLAPFMAAGAALAALAWVIWQAWEPLASMFAATNARIVADCQWAWANIKRIFLSGVQFVLQAVRPLANLLGGALQSSIDGWINSASAGIEQATAEAAEAGNRSAEELKRGSDAFNAFASQTRQNVAAIGEGLSGLNTMFEGLSNPPIVPPDFGSSIAAGVSQAEKAWEELKSKAKQVTTSIEAEWVQTTKTELEQLEIWRNQQLTDLAETKAANENYQRDLLRLEAVYSVRRKKIMEDEAKTRISIWDKAADVARKLVSKVGGLGLQGVSREKYDIEIEGADQIEEMRRRYRDWAMEYQTATKDQKEQFRQAWEANGIQFAITESGMVDFSRQMAAERVAIEAETSQKLKDLYYERTKYREDLERARNDGDIEQYQRLLESEQALLERDLVARQEYIDAYYEIWKGAHRSAMSYMAEEMSTWHDGFKDLFSGILDGTKSIGEAFSDLGKRISKMITDWVAEWLAARVMMGLSSMFGGIFGGGAFAGSSASAGARAGVRTFASGGTYAGGLALVGERGPEIINFNRGGYVYDAGQTKKLLHNETSSAPPIVINMNISTPDAGSFRRSQGQILSDMNRALASGRRNM